ncbi:hypothetical protein IFR05_012433 [Cadophora sp. M221]|nr:hypothetical protein IFR05_012433 [Cadophora sp. M221]
MIQDLAVARKELFPDLVSSSSDGKNTARDTSPLPDQNPLPSDDSWNDFTQLHPRPQNRSASGSTLKHYRNVSANESPPKPARLELALAVPRPRNRGYGKIDKWHQDDEKKWRRPVIESLNKLFKKDLSIFTGVFVDYTARIRLLHAGESELQQIKRVLRLFTKSAEDTYHELKNSGSLFLQAREDMIFATTAYPKSQLKVLFFDILAFAASIISMNLLRLAWTKEIDLAIRSNPQSTKDLHRARNFIGHIMGTPMVGDIPFGLFVRCLEELDSTWSHQLAANNVWETRIDNGIAYEKSNGNSQHDM